MSFGRSVWEVCHFFQWSVNNKIMLAFRTTALGQHPEPLWRLEECEPRWFRVVWSLHQERQKREHSDAGVKFDERLWVMRHLLCMSWLDHIAPWFNSTTEHVDYHVLPLDQGVRATCPCSHEGICPGGTLCGVSLFFTNLRRRAGTCHRIFASGHGHRGWGIDLKMLFSVQMSFVSGRRSLARLG